MRTRRRYEALLLRAYEHLKHDPERAGVRRVAGMGEGLRLYHLRHSRLASEGKFDVQRPRHLVVFRFNDQVVQIVRLLHDSMDLPERLLEP